MFADFVIGISVLIQLITVLFALRLIKITGWIKAWIFISLALTGMEVRRIFSLVETMASNPSYNPSLSFELFGLVTSLFMLTGIILISPIFETIKRNEENQRRLVSELKNTLAELQDAHSKVKLLNGFLPICASCKKIRDDKGYWNQIEAYIRDHSEAEFSHGICPQCARELYPEYYKDIAEEVIPEDKADS